MQFALPSAFRKSAAARLLRHILRWSHDYLLALTTLLRRLAPVTAKRFRCSAAAAHCVLSTRKQSPGIRRIDFVQA